MDQRAHSVSIEEKISRLKEILTQLGPTLIAFSGGVDSSFLLAVAAEVLGDQAVALMTLSPSTPPEDAQHAASLAQSLRVRLLTIQHNELTIPEYAANPTNRCYFCKDSLYAICRHEAARLGLRSIADGVNTDDLKDFRPGLRAATEYGVIHPLVEGHFTKADIRHASRLLGLVTWDKPASPCLSSRVPYGTPITAQMLSQIAQGESFLRSLGFKELRVRHHGKSARIEIGVEDFPQISSPPVIRLVGRQLKQLGFTSVTLDIEGHRSGVFNQGL
jgi:uncharacterized protein